LLLAMVVNSQAFLLALIALLATQLPSLMAAGFSLSIFLCFFLF